MVSLCNMHYSAIYNDMFRPCKWAIIRLLVEPMGRLYTKGLHLRCRHRWGDNIKGDIENIFCELRLESLRSRQKQAEGCCEHGDETFFSLMRGCYWLDKEHFTCLGLCWRN
jgi:hypothetical protein